MEIPLFPLNVVLFPGMVLPLHIFEERYKIMMHMCIEAKKPFGVALIREGQEVGPVAQPHEVGTMAAIKNVNQRKNDELDIVAVGMNRFRIHEMVDTRAYPSAEVSDYPIEEGNRDRAQKVAVHVRTMFIDYVKTLEEAANLKLKINEVPDDPDTLASLVAIAMQIELRDKQAIIECATTEKMLVVEAGLLARERMLLQHILETKSSLKQLDFGPTRQMLPN